MDKNVVTYLYTIADVIREKELYNLLDDIQQKDYQLAQVLEVIIGNVGKEG